MGDTLLLLSLSLCESITVRTEERDNVLTIPNAALRFRPESETAAAEPSAKGRRGGQVVYRVNGSQLEPVTVRLGLTNGTVTEVVSGELREGDQIALASQNAANRNQRQPQQSSPFSPQRPRGTGGRR